MAQTELTFLIASPSNKITSILNQYKISIFSCYHLLALYCQLLFLLTSCLNFKFNFCYFTLANTFIRSVSSLYYNFIVTVLVLSTLPIVIPAPTVSLSSYIASQTVRCTNLKFHYRSVVSNTFLIQLHPLAGPRCTVHLLKITNHVKVCNSGKETNLFDTVRSVVLYEVGI